ncbi:hypothetical protein [Botrimarina mediterranea]|uniref:Uncharacterized protein n=1 Tax=Botrimarina mediterranea TaxID=2528022 RepID=A0A518K7A4_9BACT|nr:hypothetical protein [Botrimarina mediterranea]QDV73681.1 hypothetical protein Spa11_18800 [Botrimarina mediterranea]QDV78271.1 hypothetical protein K2D_18780 [Planctomycetes bacterium K2D]
MTRKNPPTKKKTKTAQSVALSVVIPTPPSGTEEEKLSVDIPKQLCWRLKLALLTMESRGVKTPKKKFVEQAIAEALDRLDREWEVARHG